MKEMLKSIKNSLLYYCGALLLFILTSCSGQSNGKQETEKTVYWDTTVVGNGQAYGVCAMIDSVRQGIEICYDSLWRKTAEITYVNGKMYGPYIRYNAETGRVFIRSFYKNDMWDGPFISYYWNGNIDQISPYKDGKYHGILYKYLEDGRLSQKILFDNDTIKEILFDNHTYPLPILLKE